MQKVWSFLFKDKVTVNVQILKKKEKKEEEKGNTNRQNQNRRRRKDCSTSSELLNLITNKLCMVVHHCKSVSTWFYLLLTVWVCCVLLFTCGLKTFVSKWCRRILSVICPVVALCGLLDVKMQELSNSWWPAAGNWHVFRLNKKRRRKVDSFLKKAFLILHDDYYYYYLFFFVLSFTLWYGFVDLDQT